jgi:hypothetical protein
LIYTFKQNNQKTKEMSYDHFICVTSVINISNQPLSYTHIRSFYSHEERQIQTYTTLQTLREHFANTKCFILIVDASPSPLTEQQKQQLIENGADDVHCFRHPDCEGPFKGLGEVRIMQQSFEYINQHKLSCNYWWKGTSRMWLSEQFCLTQWLSDKPSCKYFNKEIPGMITILFNVPSAYISDFKQIMIDSESGLLQNQCIEYMLPKSGMFRNIVSHPTDKIGVLKYCAVDRKLEDN